MTLAERMKRYYRKHQEERLAYQKIWNENNGDTARHKERYAEKRGGVVRAWRRKTL